MTGWTGCSGSGLRGPEWGLNVITCAVLLCWIRKIPHRGGREYSYKVPVFTQMLSDPDTLPGGARDSPGKQSASGIRKLRTYC